MLTGFTKGTVTGGRPVAAFHLKSFASLTYFAKYTSSGRTWMYAIVSDCTRERYKNKFPPFGKDAKQPWKMMEIIENTI